MVGDEEVFLENKRERFGDGNHGYEDGWGPGDGDRMSSRCMPL